MKFIKILVVLGLCALFSPNLPADEAKARAYLVDGAFGTRSGPVRQASETEKLESDRKYLIKHALSNERSSGIAKPGDTFWTDLPADSIFEARNRE